MKRNRSGQPIGGEGQNAGILRDLRNIEMTDDVMSLEKWKEKVGDALMKKSCDRGLINGFIIREPFRLVILSILKHLEEIHKKMRVLGPIKNEDIKVDGHRAFFSGKTETYPFNQVLKIQNFHDLARIIDEFLLKNSELKDRPYGIHNLLFEMRNQSSRSRVICSKHLGLRSWEEQIHFIRNLVYRFEHETDYRGQIKKGGPIFNAIDQAYAFSQPLTICISSNSALFSCKQREKSNFNHASVGAAHFIRNLSSPSHLLAHLMKKNANPTIDEVSHIIQIAFPTFMINVQSQLAHMGIYF